MRVPGRRVLVALLLGVGCAGKGGPADMAAAPPANPPLTIRSINTTVDVAQQMRAALEMQQSGEPLAQAMGRNLNGYDRYQLPTDLYTDPATGKAVTDLVGFSTGVESYEYSKYAMNSLSFQLGAGLSLMYGPVVNPGQVSGAAALALLTTRVQLFAVGSHAGVPGKYGPFVTVPPPVENPMNLMGFPGLWAEFAEFNVIQPTLMPTSDALEGCTLSGGYGAGNTAQVVPDYECGYNTLHLPDRDGQVSVNGQKVLSADALGYAVWKQSLWVTNYFQVVHDTAGNQYSDIVNDADAAQVGIPGNTVQGQSAGSPIVTGMYIGTSDLEGFQGQIMTEEIQNKAEWLLNHMTTGDGQTLGSFQNGQGRPKGTDAVQAAIGYDYQSPLRYIPHQVTVTEAPGQGGADPQPATLSLLNGQSWLADQSALLGGYADYFAITDPNNESVGGAPPALVVFDGNPFPLDNGQPDGEPTPHDRALAMIKVALINLDRMHLDPGSGALYDQVTVQGTVQGTGSTSQTPSYHVDTVETAAAIVALRTAYRSLTSQLTEYSTATPDQFSVSSVLDGTNPRGIPGGVTLAQRLLKLIALQAEFLSNRLADASGLAVNGYDLTTGQADAGPTTLEAQAAVIRGLLAASLALSDTVYRDRAQQAYDVLDAQFYDPALRVYRTTLGNDQTFTFTPLRFTTVQAALREMYLLIGSRSGHQTLGATQQARLARLNKLVLNGWDDSNGNGRVDWPGECMRVQDGLPRGGLQMGEQALTGEVGWIIETGNVTNERDRDCVPQIVGAQLAAMMASQIVVQRR